MENKKENIVPIPTAAERRQQESAKATDEALRQWEIMSQYGPHAEAVARSNYFRLFFPPDQEGWELKEKSEEESHVPLYETRSMRNFLLSSGLRESDLPDEYKKEKSETGD